MSMDFAIPSLGALLSPDALLMHTNTFDSFKI